MPKARLSEKEWKERILSRLMAVAMVDLNDAKRIGIDMSAHLERINRLADESAANSFNSQEKRILK